MKIKINTSPIFNLIIFLAITDCGIFSILSIPLLKESGICITMVAAISCLLFFNCIINKTINAALKPYRNFINFYMILTLAFIGVFVIYSYLRYSQGVVELFNCFRHYLYLFMVSPLLYIYTKQGGYERVLKAVVWIIFVLLIVECFRAFIYNTFGINLFKGIDFTMRSGRLRTDAPPLFGIAVAYSVYKIFEEKLQKNKIKWTAMFIIIVIFELYTNMTRMYMISIFITVIMVYLLRPRPKTNQIFVWLFVILIFVFLWVSGAIDMFLDTFSDTNKEYGNSTIARQQAKEYFSLYTKDNPVFSMGFVCPTTDYFYAIFFGPEGNCCYDDLGISNMWYHYGIIGVVFTAVLAIRLIYLFIKIYFFTNSKHKVFIAGVFIFLISTQTSLSALDIQRIFNLVFIWSIFEYEAFQSYHPPKKSVVKIVRSKADNTE